MKALFLAGSMSLDSQTAHCLYLARKLSDFGVEVSVVSPSGPFAPEFRKWGVDLWTVQGSPLLHLDSAWARKAAKAAKALKPDLIHVQSERGAARGAALARAAALPYFLTVNFLPGRKLPVCGERIAGVVAGSQEIREHLVNRHRMQRTLIKVIPAGVDTAYFRPEPGQGGRPADTVPVVGMIGRFERAAGGDVFIRAASMVIGRGRRCHFLIAGEGPENESWRQLAADLGIQKHLTFAESGGDFRMLLSAIEIFVRPSLAEGSAHGLLEAMAAGRPVIASATTGVYDIVEEERSGFLVSPGDSSHLASRIMRLVDDPDLAARMGAAGREAAEKRFDIGDKAREILDFYVEKLGSRNSAP